MDTIFPLEFECGGYLDRLRSRYPLFPLHIHSDTSRSSLQTYDTNVLAVALSYLHVGGRTPTDL